MMLFSRILNVLLLSTGLATPRCFADDPPVQPNIPISSLPSETTSTEALVRGNTHFALELYKQIKGDENIFFSPNGVSEALALCFEGAGGATADQMAEVLGFPEEGADLGARFRQLRNAGANLNTDVVTFKSNNALWSQLPLREAFEASVRTGFDADVFNVDFGSSSAREDVRTWVRDRTDGAVELPGGALANPLLRLLVINTLVFKAPWAQPFDSKRTVKAPFELMDGTRIDVPTMHMDHAFRHGRWDDLEILEMPYQGGGASAFILLPAPRPFDSDGTVETLKRLEDGLTGPELEKRLNGLSPARISVHLPRFSITSNISLGEHLLALGLSLPFQNDADFSGITSADDLHIDKVLQDARIDIDEAGSEAAAVTVVTLVGRGAPREPEPPAVVFRADRPFMFLIRENSTGSILFMGRVSQPRED